MEVLILKGLKLHKNYAPDDVLRSASPEGVHPHNLAKSADLTDYKRVNENASTKECVTD